MIIKFSVIIPVYNAINTIENTLKSVINQSYPHFEILLIDDGSTDGNLEFIIKKFSDDRIKYQRISNSGGPATPRNLGIEKSLNDWISFLDADDSWDYDKLKILANTIVNNLDCVAFCHNEYYCNKNSNKSTILRYGPFEDNFYEKLLLFGNRCSTSAMIVYKPFIKKHNILFNTHPEMSIVEDYDFWLNIAKHNGKFFFLNKILGYYNIADNNISNNIKKSRHNEIYLLKNHCNNLKITSKVFTRLFIDYAIIDFRNKRYINSITFLIKSIFKNPIYFIYLIVKKIIKKNVIQS